MEADRLFDLDGALPDPDQNHVGAFGRPERGAPETQRQAAILAYPKTGSQQRAVLDVIARAGERGSTDWEAERELHGLHQGISARRNWLMNNGWIEDSGQRRKTGSGRAAAVWVLTAEGRAQWRPVKEAT